MPWQDLPKLNVAKELSALRKKLGLTQAQIGERLGISQPYVALIENETVDASARIAEKILELAGASPAKIASDLKDTSTKGIDFGEWITERRTKLGMSRQALADKAGVSYLTLYFIETGQTESPRKSTIDAIKKVLGELPKDVQTEVAESAEGGFGEYQGPFPIKEWEQNIDKDTPGVYIFYDILKRPVYIGESKDIQRRIRQHDDQFWFKSPMVHSISYLVVKDEKVRAQLEAAMIKLVGENAIFNQQHKI